MGIQEEKQKKVPVSLSKKLETHLWTVAIRSNQKNTTYGVHFVLFDIGTEYFTDKCNFQLIHLS